MAARRRLNLETIPGLLATGAVAGLVLSSAAMVAWLVVRPRVSGPPAAPAVAVDAATAEARMASAEELRARRLEFPVEGISRERLTDSFDEPRSGHVHEAADIMAPRNTPVRAVEAGTIARLLQNPSGGITVYELDPTERFIYYYAHLERYADGLREGQKVGRGEVIGYVGTSGNAPRGSPHLHFAIFKVVDQKQWWGGAPINPYLVLRW